MQISETEKLAIEKATDGDLANRLAFYKNSQKLYSRLAAAATKEQKRRRKNGIS